MGIAILNFLCCNQSIFDTSSFERKPGFLYMQGKHVDLTSHKSI